MAFSVNTNAGAFSALQNLNKTSSGLTTSQQRINTGMKVSSAKDNSAVFSMAQKMRADISGFNAVNGSIDRSTSELDVAIAAGEAVSDLLNEMKEKAVAAKDDSIDDDSRNSLNADYLQLLNQISSVVDTAEFNGRNLLKGDSVNTITSASGEAANTITKSFTQLTTSSLSLDTTDVSGEGSVVNNTVVATGSGNPFDSGDALNALNNYIESTNPTMYADIGRYDPSDGDFTEIADINTIGVALMTDFSGATPGILASSGNFLYLSSGALYTEGTGASATFTTSATSTSGGGDASAAVDAIETAIDTVSSTLSSLGAVSNRLEVQKTFTTSLSDGLQAGIGNLVDADMAKEAAVLQSLQTKQQLGLQALSLANQAPGTVMSLFR